MQRYERMKKRQKNKIVKKTSKRIQRGIWLNLLFIWELIILPIVTGIILLLLVTFSLNGGLSQMDGVKPHFLEQVLTTIAVNSISIFFAFGLWHFKKWGAYGLLGLQLIELCIALLTQNMIFDVLPSLVGFVAIAIILTPYWPHFK